MILGAYGAGLVPSTSNRRSRASLSPRAYRSRHRIAKQASEEARLSPLLQLRALGLDFLQDGYVGVGVFPAAALNALQAASPIELGAVPFGNNLSCLYPVYVRGEAYLAAGKGRAAAAEFQKILDHSGIVWNCWTGALAHLGVARANALEAKTARATDAGAARTRALAAYKDFLTLWKDADPDIPILKEAKAEYGRLQ